MTQDFDINNAVDSLVKKDIAQARAARLRLLADFLEHYADDWCIACIDDLTRRLAMTVGLPCQAGDRHG